MDDRTTISRTAALWFYVRTAGFWIVGLMNTLLARPEDVGGVKYWIGWLLLAIAVLDTGWFVYRRFFRRTR